MNNNKLFVTENSDWLQKQTIAEIARSGHEAEEVRLWDGSILIYSADTFVGDKRNIEESARIMLDDAYRKDWWDRVVLHLFTYVLVAASLPIALVILARISDWVLSGFRGGAR